MKVSDELREKARILEGYLETLVTTKELDDLADRIDSEMVELPKDRDGVPIHVGDTVYSEDGMSYEVVSFSFGRWPGGVTVHAVDGFSQWRDLIPERLTHTRHDSWERIADELDEWSEDNRVNGDGEVFDRARGFSDRIRKLAEREGER